MKSKKSIFWIFICGAALGLPQLTSATEPDSWLTMSAAKEKPWQQNECETAAPCTKTANSKPASKPEHTWLESLLNYGGDHKGVPLPFHSIEGYSGGSITPMAYLCNHCQCSKCKTAKWKECASGPSVAYSYMDTGSKDLHTVSIIQCIGGRVELGYAQNRMSLGSLYEDIRRLGLDPGRKHVYMHNFNARVNLVQEGSFGCPWLPAITAGVHFKYNQDVDTINKNLGGALSSIGYKTHYGIDYTLTATKMLIEPLSKRPVFLTGGIRWTKGAQMGLLGFGEHYNTFFEGSVAWYPTDWLILGYELRMKESPYNKIPGLIGEEDNWHAFSASVLIGKHITVSALYGLTGHVGNSSNDKTLGLQIKFEF